MKRLISLFLVSIIMLSVAFSVSAETTKESKISFSALMDEQQFRNYTEHTLFFSESVTLYGSETVHEKGYYYTNLVKNNNDISLLGYTACEQGFEETDENGVFQSEKIELSALVGEVYPSEEFTEIAGYYQNKILIGAWCYRYEKPDYFDRCTNNISAQLSIQYNQDNVITDCNLRIIIQHHPYFNELLISQRNTKIDEIAQVANTKESQYEAMKYIHNYLVLNGEYDNAALNCLPQSEKFFLAHSSFGILNIGLGVCESYAKSFKLICDKLENPPVNALMSSATHMWNAVLLDGKWYCVDATWDDQGGERVEYKYFLCGDPDIVDEDSCDHVQDSVYCPAPNYADSNYEPKPEPVPQPQPTHSLKFVPEVSATLFEEGVKQYYKCINCGKIFADANANTETSLEMLAIPATDTVKSLSVPSIKAEIKSDSVKVCWNKISNAISYNIYRKTDKSDWKLIGSTDDLSLSDKNVASGKKYQYMVYAVRGPLSSKSKSVTVKYLAPTKVQVKNTSSGMKASWNTVTGASGYTVYRRVYSKGKWSGWTVLKKTSAVSYSDKSVSSGYNYQYKVLAYSEGYTGSYVASGTVQHLSTPKVTVSNASSGVKAKWKKVSGAEKYKVYRRVYSSGKWSGWKKISTTSKTSYSDKKVSSGKKYQYYVKAYNEKTYSSYDASKSLKYLSTPKVKVSATKSNITAKWSKVSGAKGYKVYRRVYSSGKWSGWKKVSTTSKTSYKDKKVSSSKKYQYYTVAYYGSEKSAYKSSSSIKLKK